MKRSAAPIRFGPAGWVYKDWAGTVYPKRKPRGFDPLTYLSRYFDTIEINSTFYRPAKPDAAKGWAQKVSGNPRFRFTAKLWERFTHERTSAWTSDEVAAARAALDVLQHQERLGAVLVQFPWSFRRTDENREWLDDVLTAFRSLPLVLEVRHASWDTPELYTELLERGVGFVNVDQPMFHKSISPSARSTAPVGYVRVHGRNYKNWFRKDAGPLERYDYLYRAEELEPWAERVVEIAESPVTKEVYVVTNNHARGQAPANALMLESLVTHKPVEAPPELFDTYEKVLEPFARRLTPKQTSLLF